MLGDRADPWEEGGPNNAQAAWREREQRQRSLRFPLMFLLMMLLMDGEEQDQQLRNSNANALRKKIHGMEQVIAKSVYLERHRQDIVIQSVAREHYRYKYLIERNEGKDVFERIRKWKELQSDNTSDISHDEVSFYPWNCTGKYHGDWTRIESTRNGLPLEESDNLQNPEATKESLSTPRSKGSHELERLQSIGVYKLSHGRCLSLSNASTPKQDAGSGANSKQKVLPYRRLEKDESFEDPRLALTRDTGKVAFHFYSRPVPAMKEISIVDGFAKIYDTTTPGYSTGRDIVLRVSGVLVRSLGRISLVSRSSSGISSLFLKGLQKSYIHAPSQDMPSGNAINMLGASDRKLKGVNPQNSTTIDSIATFSEEKYTEFSTFELMRQLGDSINVSSLCDKSGLVFPYPFVTDDKGQTLRRVPPQAVRPKSRKEQLLENNAGGCDFEFTLDIREEELDFNELVESIDKEQTTNSLMDSGKGGKFGSSRGASGERKKVENAKRERHFVMVVNGTIFSPNCNNFSASLNATALRTDVDRPADSAMNYSFYMMLICLTQIVLVLRQLLHTQAQGAANKVSLVCIGWQATLDAVLCVTHVYLSVIMPFAFTALASVAFFKLLIFCVVELKFMAIVLQARNSSTPGNSAENLRQQITRMHVRFYLSLGFTLVFLFYSWGSYRRLCTLSLYSFWVPQIVRNVATESKRVLRRQYVCGMSLTRLLAPLFIFSTESNFLKELFPGTVADTGLCQLLVVWIGFQTALLEAQDRFGARFMIPSRFLPPKFDYFRPIPANLLPTVAQIGPSSEIVYTSNHFADERPVIARTTGQSSGSGARHRNRGNRTPRVESGMTTETVGAPGPSSPRLDCVICYNDIDVRSRQSYMLAPCNHVFHKECLMRWMEVKMECPVCRTDLPAI